MVQLLKNAVCKREAHIGEYIMLSEECDSIKTIATVEKTGLYRLCIQYFHNDWDMWINLSITCGDNMVGYTPPLPANRSEAELIILLFKGENILSFSHVFGHELFIKGILLTGAPQHLPYKITPNEDTVLFGKQRLMHTVLEFFDDELLAVRCGGKEIAFSCKNTTFGKSNLFYSGYDKIKHDIFWSTEKLQLKIGEHRVEFCFKSGKSLFQKLNVIDNNDSMPLKIISFDVGHGNASLIKLPNGKHLMVDTGEKNECHKTVLPYLKRNNINVDYFLLTHFHSDHYGCLNEILSLNGIERPSADFAAALPKLFKTERYEKLKNCRYLDSSMLCRYDELHKIWDLGGVTITVLCSRFNEQGQPDFPKYTEGVAFNEHNYENATSVSFLLRFGKFGYYHGADNYAYTQAENLEYFKKLGKIEELQCNYFYANHHFHCDVNPEFVKAVNPSAAYVPTNCSAYSRSAFVQDYGSFETSNRKNARLLNTLLTGEIGTATVLADQNGKMLIGTFLDEKDVF